MTPSCGAGWSCELHTGSRRRRTRRKSALVARGLPSLLLLAGLLVPDRVAAQDEGDFQLRRAPHALLATGLWASALTLDARKDEWSGTPACRGEPRPPTVEERSLVEADSLQFCLRSDIFVVDRVLQPPFWSSAAPLSDVLLLSMIASPFVTAGLYELGTQGEFADDGVVAFQTLGATYLATVLAKFLVRRPRPLTYDGRFDAHARSDGDARLSFPSGHSSMAFAAASLVAVMASARSRGATRIGAMAGAYGAAGLVAYLRVASRRHFFTDVLAGAALGTATGWLIPELHRTRSGSQAGSGFMMAWGGRF